MRILLPALFFLGLGTIASGAEPREPTDFEQYYLELANRARANPEAEVERLSDYVWGEEGAAPQAPHLNEGLPPDTISSAPTQPLAFDLRIIQAASDYSDFLLDRDLWGHLEDGLPRDRMLRAGYPVSPNTDVMSTSEAIGINYIDADSEIDEAFTEIMFAGNLVDWNYPGRGHRIDFFQTHWREVGVGIRLDVDGELTNPELIEHAVIDGSQLDPETTINGFVTFNYASTPGRIFVTGVIYYDENETDIYEPGESAGKIDLRVVNSEGNEVRSGMTFWSGGYSINMAGLPEGQYTLEARDLANVVEKRDFAWDGLENVKVDIVDPLFIATREKPEESSD